MVRRITLFAVLALAGLCVAAVAIAQDDDAPAPRRFGSLGDRLDQFRQDLLGKKETQPRTTEPDESFSVTRKLTRKSRPAKTGSTKNDSGPRLEPPMTEDLPDYSAVTSPDRLEPQGIRRAQTGPSASSTVVEPVDQPKGVLDRVMPTRRPIIVRPPRPGGRLSGTPQASTSDLPEPSRGEPRTAALPKRESQSKSTPKATVEEVEDGVSEPTTKSIKSQQRVPRATAVRPRVNAAVEESDVPVVASKPSRPTLAKSPKDEPTVAVSDGNDAAASDQSTDKQQSDAAEKAEPSKDESQSDEQPKSEPAATDKGETPAASSAEAKPAEPASVEASAESAEPGVLFTANSPVLSVEATGPRKVLIGKEADFVVKIRNTGAAANNVVVTINIPNYVEVHGAQASSGTAQPPESTPRNVPLEWKISRLDANGSETLELKLVPRKSTPLDLAIQWTFTPESSQTLVEVQEPKLAMSITGPDEVLYGQSKIYKLTVSNPGNGDTENVVVGLLPIGRAAENTPSHRLGTLRAGESKTIDVELTARQAGALTIKAQAFADGGLRADAAEQVLVRRASLRVDVAAPKVKYAATVSTYRVKVVNAGDATADNVQVSAMLPPDAKYVSSSGSGRLDPQLGKVTWVVGSLQPGGERLFEMQCSLSTPGENRTQFVAAADGDLSSAATATTHVEAIADLKLEVRDPQGPVAVGDEAIYEVVIRNRGTKNAEHIDLVVFFSDGLEATSVEGPSHEVASGQVLFKPISSLAAGDTATIRVHARAEVAGNHVFRAEITSRAPNVKLAAEEATHFYGDERVSRVEPARGEPAASRHRTMTEPQAAEPTPAEPAPEEPTLAPPEAAAETVDVEAPAGQ